jgi:methanogenic corrinoid protein MtbC1
MKKLTYLFLALLIVACSSDDNDNNSISINSDLVGTWSGIITSTSGNTAQQITTLNSDGTGSVSNLWDDGETFLSALVWSSTSSNLTVTTTVDSETESVEYELSNNNNTLVITRSNGIDNVYARVSINSDLVGTWSGIITSTSGNTADQILTLNSDGTGSVSNLWEDGETFLSALVWSSTSSTITVAITESNETESAEYELSNNNNTVVITRSNGIVNVYTRI